LTCPREHSLAAQAARSTSFFGRKSASGQAADFGRDLPLFRGPALRGLCRAVLAFWAALGQHFPTSRRAARGRFIRRARSSADSSGDVEKRARPSATALLLLFTLVLAVWSRGTAPTIFSRYSRLAGRDGDELDVYGRATTHGLKHADVNVLTGIARRPLKAL
jgi:hypothetical protein